MDGTSPCRMTRNGNGGHNCGLGLHKTVVSTLGSPITFSEQTTAVIAQGARRLRHAMSRPHPTSTHKLKPGIWSTGILRRI